jgi:glutaredoxin
MTIGDSSFGAILLLKALLTTALIGFVSAYSSNSPLCRSAATTTSTSTSTTRRTFFTKSLATVAMTTTAVVTVVTPFEALAAPPISVIAEELGYFPVSNSDGEIRYVPKRTTRVSSPQAIELAKQLKDKDVTMYGTYWCPHCSRQKELFGAEAWSIMNYVECSPKGYNYKGQKMCKNIDGYPTFRDSTKKGTIMNISGERDLEFLAQQINFPFDSSLENELPPGIGTTCKLR